MKTSLLLALASTFSSLSQLHAADYKGDGYSFSYSDKLQLRKTEKGIISIRLSTKDGTQFMIQNYKKLATPQKVRKYLLASMRKKFGKKMTIINGKKVSRVLMGSSREGSVMYLQITPKELLECVLITYQHNGNTFCVLTQQVVTRTLEAEAYFDQIQNSLKADNIQP